MLAATEPTDPQWYVLHVHPQREYEVAYRLRRLGYSTFIPTELRTHKRASYAKGKTQFAIPIMPGCVFAGFPSEPAWYFVLKDPRIIAPFGMDGAPWRMDFVKLFKFMNKTLDGCLVRNDAGLRLVYVPGHGMVRSLTTRMKTISPKKRDDADKAAVQEPQGRHADFISRFVHGGTA